MKLGFVLSAFVLLIALTGCYNKSTVPPMEPVEDGNDQSGNVEWYVIKIEDQRTLVVNPVPRDYSSTGGNNEYYDAVWASNFHEDAQVGQRVEIIFDGEMATSYPGQARAKQVSVLPSIRPDAAVMTEDQVIRHALKTKEAAEINVFVPTAVIFDEKSQSWTIQFKDGIISDTQKEEHVLQIPDK